MEFSRINQQNTRFEKGAFGISPLIALISNKSAQNQQKTLEKKKSSLGISGNHQLIAIEVKILDKNTSENGSMHVIPGSILIRNFVHLDILLKNDLIVT